MKKLVFVRNGPVLVINHNKLNKEAISNLTDFNLIVWRNILDRGNGYEDFCFSIFAYNELSLDNFLAILDKMISPRQRKVEEKVAGLKVSDVIFKEYDLFNHEIFFCENFTGIEGQNLNKRKFLIDLDDELIFTEEEKKFIIKTVNKKFNEEVAKASKLDIDPFSYADIFTPISVRINSKDYIIGLTYSSRMHEMTKVILCLSNSIFTKREVIIKLLSYFVYTFANNNPTVDSLKKSGNNILLNFKGRTYCTTVHDDMYIVPLRDYFDKKFEKVTLGADIEFLYLEKYDVGSGKNKKFKYELIDAYEIIKEYYNDNRNINLQKSKIGTDGDSRIGEIRTNVYQVEEDAHKKFAEEIESLLLEALIHGNRNMCHTTFSNEELSTGFHIHIGFNKKFSEFDSVEKNIIAKNFVFLLDTIFTSFMITLNTNNRFYSNYSRYCNYELKSYGFEYRSLPGSIVYYDIYKQVIELFQKVAEDYYKKGFVVVELENEDKISRKFYSKYLGRQTRTWFSNIRKLRNIILKYQTKVSDLINKYTFEPERCELKQDAFISFSDYFANELKDLIVDLNTLYTKENCIVYFYGLHRNRGDYVTTIKNTSYYIGEIQPSLFCKEIHPALGGKFNVYNVGLARKLREIDNEDDIKNKRRYLSEAIFQLLKQLEANGDLKYGAENVYAKLCKKYKFLENIYANSKL